MSKSSLNNMTGVVNVSLEILTLKLRGNLSFYTPLVLRHCHLFNIRWHVSMMSKN